MLFLSDPFPKTPLQELPSQVLLKVKYCTYKHLQVTYKKNSNEKGKWYKLVEIVAKW